MGRTCTIDGCGGRHEARGWCHKHYTRWRRYGDPERLLAAATGEPLAFVRIAVLTDHGECILWPYGKSVCGYGSVKYRGAMVPAHRLSLSLATGVPMDNPLFALHGPCNNRGCISPSHLSWGTSEQNQADRLRDGTALLGESCFQAKLTTEQVREILLDPRPRGEIADSYGVTKNNISRIKNRKSWKHVVLTPPTEGADNG